MAKTPVAEEWLLTAENALAPGVIHEWDRLAQRAESPAERLMMPMLQCACLAWLSEFKLRDILIIAQPTIPGLGRVDWVLRVDTHLAVVLEVDGLAYHESQEQFANDRRRDRAALARGYIPIRFTAKELAEGGWIAVVELYNVVAAMLQRQAERRPAQLPPAAVSPVVEEVEAEEVHV